MEEPKNIYERYEQLVIERHELQLKLKLADWDKQDVRKLVQESEKKYQELSEIYMNLTIRCEKLAHILDDWTVISSQTSIPEEMLNFIRDFKND